MAAARNVRFSAFNLTQPAEQLPLSQLSDIARMKEGDIAVFGTPLGASVVQLMHAADAPLSEQQAAPRDRAVPGGARSAWSSPPRRCASCATARASST